MLDKDEIKAYMDDADIEYSSGDTKAQLVDKVMEGNQMIIFFQTSERCDL